MTIIDLYTTVGIALDSPNFGHAQITLLKALLNIMIDQLNLNHIRIDFQGKCGDIIQELSSRYEEKLQDKLRKIDEEFAVEYNNRYFATSWRPEKIVIVKDSSLSACNKESDLDILTRRLSITENLISSADYAKESELKNVKAVVDTKLDELNIVKRDLASLRDEIRLCRNALKPLDMIESHRKVIWREINLVQEKVRTMDSAIEVDRQRFQENNLKLEEYDTKIEELKSTVALRKLKNLKFKKSSIKIKSNKKLLLKNALVDHYIQFYAKRRTRTAKTISQDVTETQKESDVIEAIGFLKLSGKMEIPSTPEIDENLYDDDSDWEDNDSTGICSPRYTLEELSKKVREVSEEIRTFFDIKESVEQMRHDFNECQQNLKETFNSWDTKFNAMELQSNLSNEIFDGSIQSLNDKMQIITIIEKKIKKLFYDQIENKDQIEVIEESLNHLRCTKANLDCLKDLEMCKADRVDLAEKVDLKIFKEANSHIEILIAKLSERLSCIEEVVRVNFKRLGTALENKYSEDSAKKLYAYVKEKCNDLELRLKCIEISPWKPQEKHPKKLTPLTLSVPTRIKKCITPKRCTRKLSSTTDAGAKSITSQSELGAVPSNKYIKMSLYRINESSGAKIFKEVESKHDFDDYSFCEHIFPKTL